MPICVRMLQTSALGQRKAFCGTALANGPAGSRPTQAPQPLQPVARAATQRLKAGPKNKQRQQPKNRSPIKGGTQRIGTQIFGGGSGGTQLLGTQAKKKVSF